MAPEAPRPRDVPMATMAGVRLRPGGRVIACHAADLPLEVGMRVIIQADRGHRDRHRHGGADRAPGRGRLSRVLRIADERDLRAGAHRRRARRRRAGRRARGAVGAEAAREDVSRRAARQAVAPRSTSRPTRASTSAIWCAISAARLRLRVEMRQVGVRDEAKMVGGIGSCGRELCCSTFLPRFAPVSIKAAKEQNIALTPSKVSGQCGRLKCCLVYEEANYVEAAKSLPRMGKRVETPDGVGPGRRSGRAARPCARAVPGRSRPRSTRPARSKPPQ